MTEFLYNLKGEERTLNIEEEEDIRELAYKTKEALLDSLSQEGLEPAEEKYLISQIMMALMRDFLIREVVDLGEIEARETEPGEEYALISIEDGSVIRGNYSPHLSVEAIKADIRKQLNLDLNKVELYQIIEGKTNQIPLNSRVGELQSKEIYFNGEISESR